MLFVISAPDKQTSAVTEQLKNRNYKISAFDNLFEFKKRVEKQTPELVLVADNLKDMNIVDLITSIKGIGGLHKVPLMGMVTSGENKSTIFFKHGAVDAVRSPFDTEELVARINLRIQESELSQHFTSSNFFWSEAQEKEQGKRTGIFKFYDNQNTGIGNVSIKEGRLVYATYGSLIKEDAFLQLACNDNLKFVFEDLVDVSRANLNEGITNLLMEAAKLKDEIKKQEAEKFEGLKVLVIDESRIARILASRVLKNIESECKVTSPNEMTVRFMVNFAPQLLIIDYQDAENILTMLWPTPRTEEDIPVIIYCDEDVKDINIKQIGNHIITGTVFKNQFREKIHSILQYAGIIS